MRNNRRLTQSEKEEFKTPRLIITICFVVLMLAYIFLLTTKTVELSSLVSIIIIFAAGILILTLGIVIKMQDKKVELDYESTVTWKLCVVAGVIIIGFGILCLFI